MERDFKEDEAEERIFGIKHENPLKYEEGTSLQRKSKEYLLSGKRLGNGLGILQKPNHL